MLYCQPKSFYNEMMYISKNRSNFIQKISLSSYEINPSIDCIDPVQYLIKMIYEQTNNSFLQESVDIFALRTYGVYNALRPDYTFKTMQIYYAKISNGFLYVSLPSVANYEIDNGTLYFVNSDEYGDLYKFNIDDIALDTYKNPYAITSYIKYSDNVFAPNNIFAKIPTNLLQHLV